MSTHGLDGAVSQFLTALADQGKSVNTVRIYKQNVLRFRDWLFESHDKTDILQAHTRDIHAYLQHLRTTQRAKPATLNLARGSLSTFYSWAVKQALINSNPASDVRRTTTVKGAPKALSEATMDELIRAILASRYTRDATITMTLLMTGLRESELCNLLVQDIDLARNTLRVYSGKGNKYREIPLPATASRLLHTYLTTERPVLLGTYKQQMKQDFVFLGQRGPITRRTVIRAVARLSKESGIPCHPHQLRHTYATFILNKTGDLTAVSALLGHSSIATTQIYTRPSQELLAERVQTALGQKGTRSSGSD